MINPFRSELLLLVQSSIGWAFLAVRAAGIEKKLRSEPGPAAPDPEAPLRLRATITIDVDAADQSGADHELGAVEQQYQALRRRFPDALLDVRRRKPRATRRPPPPTIVVTPYADD